MAESRTGRVDLTDAVYVDLTDGVSCDGMRDRAWMAWDCEYKYGCLPPLVCSASSHPSAEQAEVVE